MGRDKSMRGLEVQGGYPHGRSSTLCIYSEKSELESFVLEKPRVRYSGVSVCSEVYAEVQSMESEAESFRDFTQLSRRFRELHLEIARFGLPG